MSIETMVDIGGLLAAYEAMKNEYKNGKPTVASTFDYDDEKFYLVIMPESEYENYKQTRSVDPRSTLGE